MKPGDVPLIPPCETGGCAGDVPLRSPGMYAGHLPMKSGDVPKIASYVTRVVPMMSPDDYISLPNPPQSFEKRRGDWTCFLRCG